MAGQSNFPTSLDDDTALINVTDAVTSVVASHHNNLKEAIKAVEKKVGIEQTTSPTSLDYRLGSATNSHSHNGASGQGALINASTLTALAPPYIVQYHHQGSLPAAAANALAPFSLPRTVVVDSLHGQLRRGPSGATTALDINIGPTSMFIASQGLRPIFAPGATSYRGASPNYMTIPSGVIVTVDSDAVGSNDPGQDLIITFVFREPS